MNELLNNKLNNVLKIWLVDNTVTVENTTNRHCHFLRRCETRSRRRLRHWW